MRRMDFTEQISALSDRIADVATKLEGKSIDADALTSINEQFESLRSDMDALKTTVTEGADELDGKAVSDMLEKFGELAPELEALSEARTAKEAELDRKAMIERMDTLGEAVEKVAGKALPNFFQTNPSGSQDVYGADGEFSYFNDVRRARDGDTTARKRIDDYFEGKAMGEGTDSAGGFLVPPEVSDELIPLRDSVSVLRQLFTSQPIESDTIRFVAQDSGLAVAWTAEFAEKVQNDLSFSEFEAHVYTAAGLATVSNQLLKDAKWNVDQLITKDLAKRFVSLEEQAFINGSGNGQPLGIMQTPGVISIPYTSGSPKQVDLLDKISDGITEVQTQFLGFPDAIVMHPRTWGWLAKAREEEAPSVYLVGAGSNAVGRRASDPIPGYNGGVLPRGELFGLPVYTTPNIPTNLGDAENESAVIIGDFSQGLVLDREGIVTDTSSHVFFTSNQTVFRSEERLGFTAGRYPNAFAVIQGDGLVNH
jgi:HK97 family phage major capsid protein